MELMDSPAPSSTRSRTGSASSPCSTVSRRSPSAVTMSRTIGCAASSSWALAVASDAPLTRSVTTSPDTRRFSSSGVPDATVTPLSMMITRSQSASASSR